VPRRSGEMKTVNKTAALEKTNERENIRELESPVNLEASDHEYSKQR
jgi:hypothetical protein